ncbi:MAG: hypothetical protein LBH14_05265 [Desulfobulbaceae bacterium]|jgi:hypothetical protein|nr:hypothetical protein [Desulfobulbaceae bacterium]
MKKSRSFFPSLTLPLLLALLSASLLGGCYYPYYEEGVPPGVPVPTSSYVYYGYSYPDYYPYYGPYYYDSFWWPQPAYPYYYSSPPRRWQSVPGYRPNGPHPQPGWQHKPGGASRPDARPGSRSRSDDPAFRPDNSGSRSQPADPGFRSPSGSPGGESGGSPGGGQWRGGSHGRGGWR